MKTVLSRLFKFILIFFLALSSSLFVLYHALMINIPDVSQLAHKNPSFTHFMATDKQSKPVHFTKLQDVSPHLVSAVLAAEDDLFFVHHGFNWDETRKAIQSTLKNRTLNRGASTITQQLARNLFLSRDKSLVRKLREAIIAWRLERNLSKNRILELYLNIAEFGPGIYGIHHASHYHFGTLPKSLDRARSALVAAVLPNPKFYGKKPYPGITYARQRKILSKMAHYHFPLSNGIGPQSPPSKNHAGTPTIQTDAENLTATDNDAFKEFDESDPSEVFLDENDESF